MKDAEFAASLLKSGWRNECREHSERAFKGGGPPSVLFQLVLLFGYLQTQLSTQSGSVYLCTCSKVLIAAVT